MKVSELQPQTTKVSLCISTVSNDVDIEQSRQGTEITPAIEWSYNWGIGYSDGSSNSTNAI